MKPMFPWLNKLSPEMYLAFMNAYDEYISTATDEDKYHEGWRPVCMEEFYEDEWQMLLEDFVRNAPNPYNYDSGDIVVFTLDYFRRKEVY